MTPKTAKEWVEYFQNYPEDELIGISSIADRDDFNDFISDITEDPEDSRYKAATTKNLDEVYRAWVTEFERSEHLSSDAWETKGDILYDLLAEEEDN